MSKSKTLIARATVGLALCSLLGTLAPLPAAAREGGTSIGHGIKCYTWYNPVTKAYERVCRKGV